MTVGRSIRQRPYKRSRLRCELNPGGLLAALQDLTTEFRERNDITFEYHNRLVDLELPLEHEIQNAFQFRCQPSMPLTQTAPSVPVLSAI